MICVVFERPVGGGRGRPDNPVGWTCREHETPVLHTTKVVANNHPEPSIKYTFSVSQRESDWLPRNTGERPCHRDAMLHTNSHESPVRQYLAEWMCVCVLCSEYAYHGYRRTRRDCRVQSGGWMDQERRSTAEVEEQRATGSETKGPTLPPASGQSGNQITHYMSEWISRDCLLLWHTTLTRRTPEQLSGLDTTHRWSKLRVQI